MKHAIKIIILFFFLSSVAKSEDLESLNQFLLVNGSVKLIDHLNVKNGSQNELHLQDDILKMGSKEKVTPHPVWTVKSLSEGEGVELYLKVGQHYFANNPISLLGLKKCSKSLASSGFAYKSNKNGTKTSFSWSCGSLGCSFWVKLGEGFSVCS